MIFEAEVRHDRKFGEGQFLGDQGSSFFDLPKERQLYDMAWSHACPIPDRISKEYGVDWTLRRYAGCNFVYGLVLDQAKSLNPRLYWQLKKSVDRTEFDGTHSMEFVPTSHRRRMSPLSTPWGYAIPRVLIEKIGRNKPNPNKIQSALKTIDQTIINSQTPVEFVVKLSENLAQSHTSAKAILSHLLCSEILKEENCRQIYRQIIQEMRKSAPKLIHTYDWLLPATKVKLGIIDSASLK